MKLSEARVDYLRSPVKFYITGEQGIYSVTNSSELKDIRLIEYVITQLPLGGDVAGKRG
jgi:hypothetical protein